MQASEMEPDKSYLERLLFPTAELLTNCKLEINRSYNAARIEGPSVVIMQICITLWKKFIYCGMSYDKIILTPVKASESTHSDRLMMHLSAFEEKVYNKVIIRFETL